MIPSSEVKQNKANQCDATCLQFLAVERLRQEDNGSETR